MIEKNRKILNKLGFTLLELMLVIVIISILLTVATIAFHQWQVKSQVESQVTQMVADLREARLRAMTTKQKHSIKINGDSYQLMSYNDEDDLPATGTVIPGGTHSIKYQLMMNSFTPFSGQIYEIDPRGMINTVAAIPVLVEYGGTMASMDCLNIHALRATEGKKDASGDKCNEK